MHHEPISLSDDAMTMIMRLVQPLVRQGRVALVNSLVQLLRSEPAQPPGDGVVYRHARALLSSGCYRCQDQRLALQGSRGITGNPHIAQERADCTLAKQVIASLMLLVFRSRLGSGIHNRAMMALWPLHIRTTVLRY